MNDRWRNEIVWKQYACLGRRSGVMDREQAASLSPPLSSSVFSWAWWWLCCNTQVPTSATLLTFFFLLWLCISPCSNFLQGRRSYLGMCKDEWTYLLEQKCQNTMCLQDHKSGIVNLGKTKLATARLYLSRRNEQIIPEKWCWSFFSLAKY